MGFSKSKKSARWLNIITALFLLAAVIFFVRPSGDSSSLNQGEQPLFTLQGTEYTADNLPLKYSQPLHEAEARIYQLKQRILQAAIADLYLTGQQQQTGEDRATLAQKLFATTAPSEADMQAFYRRNQQQINAPYEQAKARIRALLIAQQQQLKQQQLVAKLQELNELEINLQPPSAPVAELDTQGYPSKGAEDAKLTLVEFGDYQCQHCKDAFLTLQEQLPPFLDRVRYVYMDFPINPSGVSRLIAEGAVCADQQQQFWAYHELAFNQQDSLNKNSPRAFAEQLNMKLDRFQSCMQDSATAAKVEASEQQAQQAGLSRTPSFFLNGRKLGPADLQGGFAALLESVLANDSSGLFNDI